jgi:hypothetical protein
MAKPNYSFEKRQRELAKKKKKEEKQLLKQKPADATPDAVDATEDEPATDSPSQTDTQD